MKIIVSRHWRLELFSTFAIEVVLIGFILLFCDDIGSMIIGTTYCIIMMLLIQVLCIVIHHRFLGYVLYQNGIYTSYFYKRKLCVINEDSKVFYTKIHGRISTHDYTDFVLLSTDPFEYRESPTIRWHCKNPKPLIVSYDVKKMILLPYEENALYLSKISQWTRIFPKTNI